MAQPAARIHIGTRSGYILDRFEQPIAGAKIVVELSQRHTHRLEWWLTQPPVDTTIGQAISDETGRFDVQWSNDWIDTPIQDTKANLLVMHEGYALAWRPIGFWQSDDKQEMTIKLDRPSMYEGLVLDAEGKPVEQASVRLEGVWCEYGRFLGAFGLNDKTLILLHSANAPTTKTDANGKFSLGQLPPGKVALLGVSHPDHPSIRRFQPIDASSPVDLGEDFRRTLNSSWYGDYGKPIQFPKGRLVEGTLIDSLSMKPLANAELCFQLSGHTVRSDDQGRFKLRKETDFAPIFVSTIPNLWSQLSPPELGKTDYLIPPVRKVAGQVRDAKTGAGVRNICLAATHSGWLYPQYTKTDAAGRYEFTGRGIRLVEVLGPRAPYVLPVRRQTTSPDEVYVEVQANVHQRDVDSRKDNNNVDFELDAYPAIAVHVVDSLKRPAVEVPVRFVIAGFVPTIATFMSDKSGVASIELDRPMKESIEPKSYMYVADKRGWALHVFDQAPENPVTLELSPTFPISGVLTFKDRTGQTVPLAHEKIALQLGNRTITIGRTDQLGNFSVFVPRSGGFKLSLPDAIYDLQGSPDDLLKRVSVDFETEEKLQLDLQFEYR